MSAAQWYQDAIDALLACESLEDFELEARALFVDPPAGYAAKPIAHMLPEGVAEELEQYQRPLHSIKDLAAALRHRFESADVEQVEGQMDVYEQISEETVANDEGMTEGAVFGLPVHPAADVWPMLTDGELDSLAASIEEMGLLQALVTWVDGDGQEWLLDGRNRLEACRRAGVEPATVRYDGDDPGLYVLGANEHRRHSTPSQRAMAVAQTVTTRFGENQWVRKNANPVDRSDAASRAQVAPRLIDSCRFVIENGPDLVAAVLAGTIKAAAAEAEARRRVAEVRRMEAEAERQLKQVTADLEPVREYAPDLADRWDSIDPENASADQEEELREEWRARVGNATSAARRFRKDLQSLGETLSFLRTTPVDSLHLAYQHGGEIPVTAEEIGVAIGELEKTVPVLRDMASKQGGVGGDV